MQPFAPEYVRHQALIDWVARIASLTQPDAIHWVDGSDEENERLLAQMVDAGTPLRPNPETHRNAYAASSDPSHAPRVDDRSPACSPRSILLL